MKIEQLLENTTPSNEEVMDSFIDHARTLSRRGQQLLLARMVEIGNNDYGWDLDIPTDDILDPRVLISTIGDLANELEGNEDFNEVVYDFLELDRTNPG